MGSGEDARVDNNSATPSPSKPALFIAFAALYIIWGSTYLAMKFAVVDFPPFLMAGVRFVIAGGILYAVLRGRGIPRPSRLHWRSSAIVGVLLLVGGNGGVAWSLQRVPSGLAALLLGATPCWMVLLDWLFARGPKPSVQICAGLIIAMIGIVTLSTAHSSTSHGPASAAPDSTSVDLLGAGVLMISSLSWAVGSIYSRRAALPASTWMSNAMQMLAGGAGLLICAALLEDWSRLHDGHIGTPSILAVAYLIVFGSLMGFSAYVWLLRVSTPARVATYAYVNPMVAVFLGWLIADETITWRTGIGALLIIGGVLIITLFRTRSVAQAATVQKV